MKSLILNKSLTLKQKLYLMFSAVLCITLILGVYPLKSQSNQGKILMNVIIGDEELYKARLSQADYIILNDSQIINQVFEHAQSAVKHFVNTATLMSVPSSIDDVRVIQENVNTYLNLFKKYVSIKKALSEKWENFFKISSSITKKVDDAKIKLMKKDLSSDKDLILSLDKLSKVFEKNNNYFLKYQIKRTKTLENLIKTSISNLDKQSKRVKEIYQSTNSDNATYKNVFNDIDTNISIFHEFYKSIVEKNDLLEETKLSMIKAAYKASANTKKLVNSEGLIAKQHTAFVNQVTMGLMLAAFIICLLLGRWLTKSIMGSIKTSIDFAEGIAKGDLSHILDSMGHDEFSQLNIALCEIVASLRNIIDQVIITTQELEHSSRQISLSVDNTVVSVQKQQSETEMVVTAVNELAAAAMQITQSAQSASTASLDAEKSGAISQQVVTRTEEAMSELSNTLNHATSVVDDLSANSANIESILVVIRSIADQTNLLALNAAIEAARAGEQGRGFAVVADEVRTLAQKTQDSISEINSIIESIQSGAKSIVHEMEASNEKGSLVVSLTAESSESLTQIVNAIQTIVETNNQVAVGAEEQSLVAEEVDRNIIKIKGLSQDNSENLDSIKSQMGALSTQSQSLSKLVSFFKV